MSVGALATAAHPPALSFIYTETPSGELSKLPFLGLSFEDRIPDRATLQLVDGSERHPLVPGFAASADANVSFDAKRVLFSGKEKPSDPWQIWEIALAGGAPRRVTTGSEDCVRPFYLPGDKFVYSRSTPDGFQLEIIPLAGGTPLRLTYAPGPHIATDVLHDGRVLFELETAESFGPAVLHSSKIDTFNNSVLISTRLYTVYTDGSGFEAYRDDQQSGAYGTELASGDIVFDYLGTLARFTSALATQVPIPLPKGEFAGPIAEIAPNEWLVSYRPKSQGPFALYRLEFGDALQNNFFEQPGAAAPKFNGRITKVLSTKGNAIEPVLVRPRPVPLQHPSGLGNREGANLLCLNAYTSHEGDIAAGTIATVRLYTLDEKNQQMKLGETAVDPDGSFFLTVPSEKPLRFELADKNGKVIRAEENWFWARRGEQRVCVGCHAGAKRAPENAVAGVLLRTTDPVKMLPIHTAPGGPQK